ncbi:MAG: hypothetical protein EOP44_03180 [Sphingobacteriaceae bacterium]|nr:MAG: hypothetical protein EOP44_03180 [Sphingobacteriaceae bacterium]
MTKALPNLILAGIAGAAGLAEVAVIASEKPPAYEKGGYSAIDYNSPQGYVKRPTLFAGSAARPFLAGEGNKTEYIISSEQLRDPVIANFVGAMEANRGVRRFEAGGYSNAKLKSENTTSTPVPIYENINDDVVKELQLLRTSIKNQKVIRSYRLEQQENEKIIEIQNNANA